jgi:cytochrome c-type biogenesis protein
MEGIFLGGSLFAAFVAGAVALFAPCCIVFMFPAYLAAAVRNRRWRLVPLTFVFAAGISVVLLPVTLGVGLLTRSLLRFHGPVYFLGGLLLLGLGAIAAMGISWALPMLRSAPDIQRTDSGGVFALGVFSGAASACCAPVLAGVLTLSAVSPSLGQGIAVGLTYVFGMVFPLLVMTMVWDRLGLGDRKVFRGREVQWGFAGRTFITNTVNLIAAGMFALMGIVLVVVAVTGSTIATTFQAGIGTWIEDRLVPLVGWMESVPDVLIAGALLAIAVTAVVISGRGRPTQIEHEEEGHCHDPVHKPAPQADQGAHIPG